MLASFFRATGRADRLAFWRAAAVIGILYQVGSLAFLFIALGLFSLTLVPFYIGMLVLLAIAIWAGVAIGIRRLHDRDRSGWWMLLAFVPLVGTLWHLVANGCFAGTPGPNRYGASADDSTQAITAVFGDGGAPRAGRKASMVGTIVLWVVLLLVTIVTVALFQDPTPRSA